MPEKRVSLSLHSYCYPHSLALCSPAHHFEQDQKLLGGGGAQMASEDESKLTAVFMCFLFKTIGSPLVVNEGPEVAKYITQLTAKYE